MDTIQIKCLNNNQTRNYQVGISLFEIIKDMNIELDYKILGARVNNKIMELNQKLYQPKYVEFIDITNIDGHRMYQRSLSFVLMKAVRDLFPESKLQIEHSISKGFYCKINKEPKLKPIDVLQISQRMREIVKSDLIFERQQIPTSEAIEKLKANKLYEKAKLFKIRKKLFTSLYTLGDQIDYFYGYLVPSTKYLQTFDLIPYYNGMLLRFPLYKNPYELGNVTEQHKLFDIFREYKEWSDILNISTIGSINQIIQDGNGGELIKVAEALSEKKVAHIADKIVRKTNIKVVLISGPSSSGKTTFSKRLAIQLKVLGIRSELLSLDNFFCNRVDTPKDENGDYNFESLYALNLELFEDVINSLIAGQETILPEYDFLTGINSLNPDKKIKMTDNSVLIIEGIHGLNPELSKNICSDYIFKIYVSALTQLGIDWHNRIPTTDNRLIRRMVRDYQYRGYSPEETLKRWASVRRGETKNIFPFQEEADVMFNSSLLYEFSILKKYAEPLLKQVPENVYEYSEAKRLLKFLSYFEDINKDEEDEIPPTSILREFLHGSSFKY